MNECMHVTATHTAGHRRSCTLPGGQYGIRPTGHDVELQVLLAEHTVGSTTSVLLQYCAAARRTHKARVWAEKDTHQPLATSPTPPAHPIPFAATW
jgi:hypothetical protein